MIKRLNALKAIQVLGTITKRTLTMHTIKLLLALAEAGNEPLND